MRGGEGFGSRLATWRALASGKATFRAGTRSSGRIAVAGGARSVPGSILSARFNQTGKVWTRYGRLGGDQLQCPEAWGLGGQ
jgi:hypothetical protein